MSAFKKLSLTFAGIAMLGNSAFALQNAESPYLNLRNDQTVSFGGLSLSYVDDVMYLNLQALEGSLIMGPELSLPYSVSFKAPSDGVYSEPTEISQLLLSTDEGILNLKLNLYNTAIRKKNDFNKDNFSGICAFETFADGMCQFRIDTGLKTLSYEDVSDSEKYATSLFLSAGFQLDVPFSWQNNNPYQRLTVSASYSAQWFDTETIYRAGVGDPDAKSVDKVDSVNLAIDHQISRTLSVQISGPVWTDADNLSRKAEISLNYRPFN